MLLHVAEVNRVKFELKYCMEIFSYWLTWTGALAGPGQWVPITLVSFPDNQYITLHTMELFGFGSCFWFSEILHSRHESEHFLVFWGGTRRMMSWLSVLIPKCKSKIWWDKISYSCCKCYVTHSLVINSVEFFILFSCWIKSVLEWQNFCCTRFLLVHFWNKHP